MCVCVVVFAAAQNKKTVVWSASELLTGTFFCFHVFGRNHEPFHILVDIFLAELIYNIILAYSSR